MMAFYSPCQHDLNTNVIFLVLDDGCKCDRLNSDCFWSNRSYPDRPLDNINLVAPFILVWMKAADRWLDFRICDV